MYRQPSPRAFEPYRVRTTTIPLRELFDLPEGPEPSQSERAARRSRCNKPLPKRFYTEAAVAAVEEGHAIHLDGKPVRTPAKNLLLLPTAELAELVRN